MSTKADLTGGRELIELMQSNPRQGALLQRIITGINTLGRNIAVSPTGQLSPPPQVGGVNVKVAGELAHVTISDAAPIQKGINYHIEYDTNPSFTQPHVVHLGPSRGTVLNLPTKTDGGATQTYYFRGYSQYNGSKPSEPTVHGGISPTAVTMGGSTQLTLLPSTGSGTASSTGGQGGSGLGKVLTRNSVGPKRG